MFKARPDPVAHSRSSCGLISLSGEDLIRISQLTPAKKAKVMRLIRDLQGEERKHEVNKALLTWIPVLLATGAGVALVAWIVSKIWKLPRSMWKDLKDAIDQLGKGVKKAGADTFRA